MSENHGNTPAAWTAVVVALLGFVVGAAGLMLEPIKMVVFWIGVAIVIAGGLTFVAMSRMGYHDTKH